MLRKFFSLVLVISLVLKVFPLSAHELAPIRQQALPRTQALVGSALFVLMPVVAEAAIATKQTVGTISRLDGSAWWGPALLVAFVVGFSFWKLNQQDRKALTLLNTLSPGSRIVRKYGESGFGFVYEVVSPEFKKSVFKMAGGRSASKLKEANENLIKEIQRSRKLEGTGIAPTIYKTFIPTDLEKEPVCVLRQHIEGIPIVDAIADGQLTYDEAIEEIRILYTTAYEQGFQLWDATPKDLFWREKGMMLQHCDLGGVNGKDEESEAVGFNEWDIERDNWITGVDTALNLKRKNVYLARLQLESRRWWELLVLPIRYVLSLPILGLVEATRSPFASFWDQPALFIEKMSHELRGWMYDYLNLIQMVLPWLVRHPLEGYVGWRHVIGSRPERGVGFFAHVLGAMTETLPFRSDTMIQFLFVTKPGVVIQTIQVKPLDDGTVALEFGPDKPLSIGEIRVLRPGRDSLQIVKNHTSRAVTIGEISTGPKGLEQQLNVLVPIHGEPSRAYIRLQPASESNRPLVAVLRDKTIPTSADDLKSFYRTLPRDKNLPIPLYTSDGTVVLNPIDAINLISQNPVVRRTLVTNEQNPLGQGELKPSDRATVTYFVELRKAPEVKRGVATVLQMTPRFTASAG